MTDRSLSRTSADATATDRADAAEAALARQEAYEAAVAAGLTWINDAAPGWCRVRTGTRDGRPVFAFRDAAGRAIDDERALDRIRRLAIPPAWEEVWICPRANGHIQATGRDARGRKQYRYHPEWAAGRGQTKFSHLAVFGQALPRIRARVQRALAEPSTTPTRERVLATLVRLLDTTWLRIGNPEYARDNASFGLSTLKNRHADARGETLRLSFTGKSGVRHEVRLSDRRVAGVVRRCRELPGQELFQYVDADGSVRRIGSADVNAWLAEAAGTAVTAKDFRTWHGSVQALELTLSACLDDAGPCKLQDILKAVAQRLGNTVAVCRKAYVHPEVISLTALLADEASRLELRGRAWVRRPPALRGLRLAERRLLGLLHRLQREQTRQERASAMREPRGLRAMH